jgi:hypothetical protein
MKLRTIALALVALCLTVVANAHPIGKYIRHKNIATADHVYSYNGHGHDKYSKAYNPHNANKNFYYCSGLGHHATCKHGHCHYFDNGHHMSRHARRYNRICHDHKACKPHSGASCGHHSCSNVCQHTDHCTRNTGRYHRYGVHPQDQHHHGCEDSCGDSCDHGEKEMDVEVEDVSGDSKNAKIRVKVTEE